jgi:hypothetical protein
MRKSTLVIAALTLLATQAIGHTVVNVKPGAGNTRRPAAVMPSVPKTPSAPLTGVVTSIAVANKSIGINRQSFRMNEPLVAVIDKRPGANGLFELTDLRPGMKVRYRAQREADGVERVVELWIMGNAPVAGDGVQSGRKL